MKVDRQHRDSGVRVVRQHVPSAWLICFVVGAALVGWCCWEVGEAGRLARDRTLPVITALMLDKPVPNGWTLGKSNEQRRSEFLAATGKASEAYALGTNGYPGNHHFSWYGLSRRNGDWYFEEALFLGNRNAVAFYGTRKIQAEELEELMAKLDQEAAEKSVRRDALNLVR